MTTIRTGFDAMGHPVPESRKQAGYAWLRTMFTQEEATSLVNAVANKLERDQPYEAQKEARERGLDLTGVYRLMAVLLTDAKTDDEEELESVRDTCR